MTGKLRLVVFTAGQPAPADEVFFSRLASDPRLDLAAIIFDDHQPRRRPLLDRVIRAIRNDGPAWIAFKLAQKARRLADRVIQFALDRIHGPRRQPSLQISAAIHRVADIHSSESLELIRSLAPDLGVIVGGRILQQAVIEIPRFGTLNIHKHKLPQYRGGGPAGYWELLGGETSLSVSIHFATSQVDAGPVLAEETIAIEDYDTLESLRIKADIRGAQLYLETLRRFALGQRHAQPQDLSQGKTYRAPGEYRVWQLERRLEKRAAAGMDRNRLPRATRWKRLAGYVLLLPRLLHAKRSFKREGRMPISILFYHLVSGRPLNHMCLRFARFVRQIEFIRRYYPILSLDEAVQRLRSGRNEERAVAITFDDGYRDNEWAIEYLRYFGIPATFFISIAHVRDGSRFEHDSKRGFEEALPMSEAGVRRLYDDGFTIGSHGLHHEDFGVLSTARARDVLRESAERLAETCGVAPQHFAFPKGQRGINITRESFAAALEQYQCIFSAYGGHSFPEVGRRHFIRNGNPPDAVELGLVLSGYPGLRECLRGDHWGVKTSKLDPCSTEETAGRLRIALVAASPEIIGGHSVQANALVSELRNAGHDVSWIPIDVRFPRALAWVRRVPYLRTVLNELLYAASLYQLRRADIVHIFSASYWSFLLAPVPAIVAAKLMRKRIVLHYHSGEADDHLTRWRRIVRPFLRMADEIVVPSVYLQRIFESHGYESRVIPNVVDTDQFRYREREKTTPRLLSVRNLEDHYRIDNTIAAFAKVKSRFPEATLTVAGAGSAEDRLRRLAESSVADGVRFLGRVEPSQLPAVVDQADIFLNSSVVDNQPVSILEAFAAGLPVVSTPTGDIRSMLRDGEAGLLVPPGDPDSMADAVTRLVESRDLSTKLSRAARIEVERHALPRVRAEWLSLYANMKGDVR